MADQDHEHQDPSSKRPRLMDQPVNFNYQLPTAPLGNCQPHIVADIPPQMQLLEGGAPRINHDDALPNQNPDDDCSSFPPGYMFSPFDDELVKYYLIPKVFRKPLPTNMIPEVNIYHDSPLMLAATYTAAYEKDGEFKWYFFTPRNKKYPNGKRPRRSAPDGFWRANGTEIEVRDKASGKLLGHKKGLVYYRGDPTRKQKTAWIMHEFRVSEEIKRALPTSSSSVSDPMLLDEWVLCRIFHKPGMKDGMNSELQLLQEIHQSKEPPSDPNHK